MCHNNCNHPKPSDDLLGQSENVNGSHLGFATYDTEIDYCFSYETISVADYHTNVELKSLSCAPLIASSTTVIIINLTLCRRF